MKKCLKCNNDLPNMIIINEKKHNICNRKFCLECSPFKAHNTSNLLVYSINEGTTKKCSICNLEKDINEFFKKKLRLYECKSDDPSMKLYLKRNGMKSCHIFQ